MAEKGGTGFPPPSKPPLNSTSKSAGSLKGKEDGTTKSKRGSKKLQIDSAFGSSSPAKSSGKADPPISDGKQLGGGDGVKTRSAAKIKEPRPLELKVGKDNHSNSSGELAFIEFFNAALAPDQNSSPADEQHKGMKKTVQLGEGETSTLSKKRPLEEEDALPVPHPPKKVTKISTEEEQLEKLPTTSSLPCSLIVTEASSPRSSELGGQDTALVMAIPLFAAAVSASKENKEVEGGPFVVITTHKEGITGSNHLLHHDVDQQVILLPPPEDRGHAQPSSCNPQEEEGPTQPGLSSTEPPPEEQKSKKMKKKKKVIDKAAVHSNSPVVEGGDVEISPTMEITEIPPPEEQKLKKMKKKKKEKVFNKDEFSKKMQVSCDLAYPQGSKNRRVQSNSPEEEGVSPSMEIQLSVDDDDDVPPLKKNRTEVPEELPAAAACSLPCSSSLAAETTTDTLHDLPGKLDGFGRELLQLSSLLNSELQLKKEKEKELDEVVASLKEKKEASEKEVQKLKGCLDAANEAIKTRDTKISDLEADLTAFSRIILKYKTTTSSQVEEGGPTCPYFVNDMI